MWCSAADLFGLNMDLPTLREVLRPNATVAVLDGAGKVWASGPFGEVTVRGAAALPPTAESDSFMAAICAALARTGDSHEGASALWTRALEQGYAATMTRLAAR